MEASLAAPSIDETSPAAGEERCVSLDEISDCAPRQDSHAWAENRPSLLRGQQVVCPVCRKTSWIPPGFL